MKPALILKLPPAAAVMGVNAVPVLGWLRETWTAETAMLLYYLETVAVLLLAGVLVRLAVPAADARGIPIAAKRNKLVRDYWLVMGGFAFVIGVFLAVMLLLFRGIAVPWAAVGAAMVVIVALQLFAYGWEAYQLRPLDMADAETLISRDMGRIAILHLGVLFGVFLAAFRTEWFVWPFLVLKTIVDIGTILDPALSGLRATGVLPARPAPGDDR